MATMASDDGHELDVGCRIRLSGLVKANHLNGKLGIIDDKAEDDDDRWIVVLEEDDENDESKRGSLSSASAASRAKTQRRVKVRPANCILVANEDSRLKEAMESKNRDTIRSIMLSRQSRKNHKTTVISSEDDKKAAAFDREMFCCPICHNLLYKPCVNSCGHAFCFWCLHHAMNGVGTSKCPLCRAPYTRFSAPLQLLHRFLIRAFAEETQQRSLETKEQEKSEFADAQSPTIDLEGSHQPHLIGPVDVSELVCISCHDVAKDPVVPACGHLICRECVVGSASTGDPQCMECSTPILDDKAGGGDGDVNKELKVCAVLQPLLSSINGAVDRETIKTLCREGENKKVESSSIYANPPAVKVEFPEINKESKHDFIHFFIGCDGCGQYPMKGHAFRCLDCPEQIGFDLCRACFQRGVHLRPDVFKGRFNQSHKSTHKFQERKQTRTDLHHFMDLHPELTPAQIMHLVQLQNTTEDDEASNDRSST